MKNFDWDAFGKERNKIAVWCKTEEEAIDFCNQSHEHGYDWISGRSRAEITNWDSESYAEETCYTYDSYCSKSYFKLEEYKIVEWSDYMDTTKPVFTKSDLKDGDIVLKRNGDVEIAIPSVGVFVRVAGFNSFNIFNDDLTSTLKDKYDIVEVRRPNKPSDCVFECFDFCKGEVVYNRERDSEPVVEMTLEEVCEALGKKIKIVEE